MENNAFRDIAVVTYSQVRNLVKFSHGLLGDDYHRIVLGSWSPTYIEDLVRIESDWIVHVDEDSFVFRPESIDRLIDYMDTGGYAACGMPDGGVISSVSQSRRLQPFLHDLEPRGDHVRF